LNEGSETEASNQISLPLASNAEQWLVLQIHINIEKLKLESQKRGKGIAWLSPALVYSPAAKGYTAQRCDWESIQRQQADDNVSLL